MSESTRIEMCQNCNKDFCRNCSNSDWPDDYCSKECEKEAELKNNEDDEDADIKEAVFGPYAW